MMDNGITQAGARYSGRHAKLILTVEGLISDSTDLDALAEHLSARLAAKFWQLPGNWKITGDL